jgi:hypothetical protein
MEQIAMRISVRYDDEQKRRPGDTREPELCNVDLYLNTRDDLIVAQNVINAMLNVLPQAAKKPTSRAELEALLNSEDDTPVEILPDGRIREWEPLTSEQQT